MVKKVKEGNKGERKSMTLIDVMLDLQQTEPEFYTHETVKGVILVRNYFTFCTVNMISFNYLTQIK